MSLRHNKRKNPFHRERTVTTLTEDPTTHLLVPTPTEEPARYPVYPHQVHDIAQYTDQDQYYPQEPLDQFNPENYPMPAQTQTQTQFYAPQQPQTDLEVLQNLKEMIKAGQHEFYRAVPQPQALAAIYLGPNAQVSRVSTFSLFLWFSARWDAFFRGFAKNVHVGDTSCPLSLFSIRTWGTQCKLEDGVLCLKVPLLGQQSLPIFL